MTEDAASSPQTMTHREKEGTLPIYMKVQRVLYNIVIIASIMVSLIYWSVLFPLRVIYEGFKTDFNDIAVHALNVVLILKIGRAHV